MPLASLYQKLLNMSRYFDGVAPLALRIYLAPVLMQAGYNKLAHFDDTVAWFANPDWGLGLPMPAVMAGLAAGTEFFGAILLLLGLATRLISIPLMVTMLVAAFTVHWPNGWLAIADGSSWLANDRVLEAGDKLAKAKEILQEHGNYDWLTSSGNLAVLNNGIEFAATYFIMLLALFTLGGGRYTSLDYFIAKRCGVK
ncbi:MULTISPECIES: HvfX family Cu-binding RiPP maturation protein [Shewanella]|mgnify:FL=1|uniref:DoxX family protein n=1 Tax=Shewanella baltica (strain OS155 / ATCC BAA-1091) TaxID=325240 RepID=A3D3K1_SHEB5|nr:MULTISPECIES: DoxX family protein [Shewanella]ABN61314.1 DoxX family protein [Shewanella baltica OS155]AEH13667.1 DoxX family protein [Shewanella baltica OS117]MCB2382302.1 DoxX family protein [Shewanella sp. SR1]MCS6096979.1 DoxX family protein [Shewanella baltica]MCS6228087.1 DoxX family protein [Shewanella baltica]